MSLQSWEAWLTSNLAIIIYPLYFTFDQLIEFPLSTTLQTLFTKKEKKKKNSALLHACGGTNIIIFYNLHLNIS